jgi:SOS regulatory protein LexA
MLYSYDRLRQELTTRQKPGGLNMTQDILTIDEVADYLKVNIRTVYRMLKAQEVPAFKVRNQWRFKREDVDVWITKHTGAERGSVMVIEAPFTDSDSEQTVEVPVLGRAACGMPMLAEENIEQYIPVSKKIAASPYKYYMLRAKGDSMNQAGINDGDLVLVRQQSTARHGDIVVALIDDEATIKEYTATGSAVVLKPHSDNAIHKPIILMRDFMVQGVVVTTIAGI